LIYKVHKEDLKPICADEQEEKASGRQQIGRSEAAYGG
jgi:hypothetical protein